jgi:hypothetical protein
MSDEIVSNSQVLIDGDISVEKLIRLIKIGSEEEQLDYKREYDFSKDKKDKIELVRDVIGMANTHGGYVIFGVHEVTDENGKHFDPNGMSTEVAASLDVSAFRQQIEAYVSERIEVKFASYKLKEFNDQVFGILYVAPNNNSPIIFAKDGQYKEKNGDKPKDVMLFRSGDIVVRKGASTERVDQSEMRRIISEIRQREKMQWTEDILGIRELTQRFDKLIEILSKQNADNNMTLSVSNSPTLAQNFDETIFYLSPLIIYNKITELLENQKNVSVQRYINVTLSQFFQHIEKTDLNDTDAVLTMRDNHLLPILDSLVGIAITCIEYKQWDLLNDVKNVFYRLCFQAEKDKFPNIVQPPFIFNKIWLWQEVMIRVYAIGGLLIYRKFWLNAESLIEQEIEWDDYYRTSYWSRYFLVMASRARQLQEKGWIPEAVNYVEKQEWLSSLFMKDKDIVINAICQFDFIQCIYTACSNHEKIDATRPFPSFGLYYKQRTEPIISQLITPGELRNSVSFLDNVQLAKLIQDLSDRADKAFLRFSGWGEWEWSDQKIINFINTHYPKI